MMLMYAEPPADPKEPNMSLTSITVKLTGITLDQANAAADMGFDAGRSTATFVGDPAAVLAMIRRASADLKAAKKARGERVGNAPHIDNLARKYEAAAMTAMKAQADADAAATVEAFTAAADDLARRATIVRTNRIPVGALTHVCGSCHIDLPVRKFPTVTGPNDRRTTCRACAKAR